MNPIWSGTPFWVQNLAGHFGFRISDVTVPVKTKMTIRRPGTSFLQTSAKPNRAQHTLFAFRSVWDPETARNTTAQNPKQPETESRNSLGSRNSPQHNSTNPETGRNRIPKQFGIPKHRQTQTRLLFGFPKHSETQTVCVSRCSVSHLFAGS